MKDVKNKYFSPKYQKRDDAISSMKLIKNTKVKVLLFQVDLKIEWNQNVIFCK